MAFLKRKSVIITICVLVSTLIFSAIGLGIFYVVERVNNKKSEASLVAPDIMDGGGGGASYCTINSSNLMDSTKYSSYTYFKVYDKEGLLSLDDNEDGNKFGNYSGKFIYLEADINLGWTNRGAVNAERGFIFSEDFAGVFDGKGHTISNAYHHAERGAFFCLDLSGTVRNVKFSNIMRFIEFQVLENPKGAIIADTITSSGNVSSCEFNNPAFMANIATAHAGVIAVTNNGTIKNCLVSGSCKYGGHDTLLAEYAFRSFYPFVENQNATLQNCIFAATKDECRSGKYNGNDSYEWEGDYSSIGGSRFKEEYHSNYSSHDNAKGKLGTSCNSVGGESSSVAWYQEDSYQSDIHFLRVFMNWSTISLSAGDGGTVNKTSIQIPSDAFKNFDTYFSGFTTTTPTYPDDTVVSTATLTANPIEIYGQKTTATASAGYVFSGWTVTITRNVTWRWIEEILPVAAVLPPIGSGRWYPSYGAISSVACQARFTEETYNISFANVTLDTYSKAPNKTSITTKYNQSVSVNIDYSATATVITYTIGSEEIKYIIDAKYTIKSFGAIDKTTITKDTSINVPDLTQGLTYTITPTIQLRQHSSEFN